MMQGSDSPESLKPLAGNCAHVWEAAESPYAVAEVCKLCKLYRYKTGATADWEYRAPIPIGQLRSQ